MAAQGLQPLPIIGNEKAPSNEMGLVFRADPPRGK